MMRLTDAERERWVAHGGACVDPYRDRPTEEIGIDEYGRLHVDSTVSCGVYVVINADDVVVYIGKVDRITGSIADRFRSHHAAADDWDRVWVLPFRHEANPAAFETAMIQHFAPQDNVKGHPCL